MRDRARNLVRYFLGSGLGPYLIRASAGGGAVQLAGMIASFAVGVLLARGLGVESYGQYGIAMAVISVAGIFGEFGLPRLVIREVAAASANSDLPRLFGVMRWANRTAVLLSIAAAAVVALMVPLLIESSGVTTAIVWGAPFIPLVALIKVRGAALQGIHFVVLGQVPFNLLRPLLLSLMLLPLLILVPQPVAAQAMALNVASAALALAAAEAWLRRRLPQPRPAELTDGGSSWLASAFPMALTDGIRVLQAQLIILLLGLLAPANEVGLFRVAIATAAMVAVPTGIIGAVLAPQFARLHAEGDLRRLRLLSSRSAQLMTASVLALSLPIFIAGSSLIALLFGAEYRGAVPSLMILCIGQILNALFGPNGNLLLMSGHERRTTRATFLSLIVAFIGTLGLVPMMGMLGAALAASLSLLVWNVTCWVDARRRLQIDTSVWASVHQQ